MYVSRLLNANTNPYTDPFSRFTEQELTVCNPVVNVPASALGKLAQGTYG